MRPLDRFLLAAFDQAHPGLGAHFSADRLRLVAQAADRRGHVVAAMARLSLLAIGYRRDGREAGAMMALVVVRKLRAALQAPPEGVWVDVSTGDAVAKGLELV